MTHFHAPEPWHLESNEKYGHIICDAQGFHINTPENLDAITAQRIVDCVNACIGIEPHDLKEVIELGRLKKQQNDRFKMSLSPLERALNNES